MKNLLEPFEYKFTAANGDSSTINVCPSIVSAPAVLIVMLFESELPASSFTVKN